MWKIQNLSVNFSPIAITRTNNILSSKRQTPDKKNISHKYTRPLNNSFVPPLFHKMYYTLLSGFTVRAELSSLLFYGPMYPQHARSAHACDLHFLCIKTLYDCTVPAAEILANFQQATTTVWYRSETFLHRILNTLTCNSLCMRVLGTAVYYEHQHVALPAVISLHV